MTYKIFAGFLIGGMLLAACASLPQDFEQTSAPPVAGSPEPPALPTSSRETESGVDRTPSADQPFLGSDSDRSPLEPIPDEGEMARGSVIIDSTEVLIVESFPPHVRLRIEGSLPTPCHQLRAELEEPGEMNRIEIELYSLVDPDQICTQVMQPFERTIDLGSYPPGDYEVVVNGEVVGPFSL